MESGGLVAERTNEVEPAQSSRRRPAAEDIAWVGLWPISLALIAAIIWLAPPLSHLYPGPAQDLFPVAESVAKPEPLEQTRVLLALIAPFALAAFVLLGSPDSRDRRFDRAVIALQLAAVGLIAWGVVEQEDGPFIAVPEDYFKPLLITVPILVAGVLIGFALALTAVALRRADRLDRVGSLALGWPGIAVAAAVLLTALWLLPAVVTDATLSPGPPIASSHIPVQAGDYFAVANGRTPLVDYVPQYVSLLPLAAAPLLEAFDLSFTSFSVLMAGLSLIALLALFGVLLEVTERPLVALALYLPLLAFGLIPWNQNGADWDYNAAYYGVFPGRYLGPFILAFLCALAVRRRRLPGWLLFLAAGLVVLNNAEFGLPAVIALFVALVVGADRSRTLGQTVRTLAPQALVGFAAALVLTSLVTLVRAGELPDLGLLTFYGERFARDGYGLVPMPTLGFHIAMYLTYVAAILVAAVRYAQSRPGSVLTAMLAYAGTFGLLTSTYFAGRSLPWQLMLLFPVWGLTLALLTWVAAQSFGFTAANRASSRSLVPSLAVLCGFGVMVAAIATFPPPWRQVERLSESGVAAYDSRDVQRYIEDRTNPGEKILFIGTYTDHRLAERAGVVNVSPWNYALSLFSERDVLRALDALEREGGSEVFVYRGAFFPTIDPLSDAMAVMQAHGYRQVTTSEDDRLVVLERS
jgi:hypothetical protein